MSTRSSSSTRPRRSAPEPRLSLRDLNRATLARQLLLARTNIAPAAAIEQLAGLQAQVPRPPFLGLWTRVAGFERADLHALIHARTVVRATMMRGTIHLVSARDYLALRSLRDAPRPGGDTPAPVRFLPEYDNLMLAYADHSRVIDPARRKSFTTKNGIIAATFLVDGRVAGTWTIDRVKARATLTLAPYGTLTKPVLSALTTEAEALLRFVEPDATTFVVR